MRYIFQIITPNKVYEAGNVSELVKEINEDLNRMTGLENLITNQKIYDILNKRVKKPKYFVNYQFIRKGLKDCNLTI